MGFDASLPGAHVLIVADKPQGTKLTGKFGYPVTSDCHIASVNAAELDALVIPGGFAPDYMRRCNAMLALISAMIEAQKPVAAICHGPWMLCSARTPEGAPVVSGRRATCFVSIKDDLINAGATYEDAAVVIDGPLVTSRTPQDLIPFVQAIMSRMHLHAD